MKTYKKIDMYVKIKGSTNYVYAASTIQSKTLKQAKKRFSNVEDVPVKDIKANYSTN